MGKLIIAQAHGANVVKVIILWFGSVATIPVGFSLCDGTLGTMDLRNRFVIAGNPDYGITVGTIGGIDSGNLHHEHILTDRNIVESPPHKHTVTGTMDSFHFDLVGGNDVTYDVLGIPYAPPGANVQDHGHTFGIISEDHPSGSTISGHTHREGIDPSSFSSSDPEDLRPSYYALCYISGLVDDVPIGGIVVYTGDYSVIPSNFLLCNGMGGTPNLFSSYRAVYIIGAGGAKSVNDNSDDYEIMISAMFAHTHGVGGEVYSATEHEHWDRDHTNGFFAWPVPGTLVSSVMPGVSAFDTTGLIHQHAGGDIHADLGALHTHDPNFASMYAVYPDMTDHWGAYIVAGYIMRMS